MVLTTLLLRRLLVTLLTPLYGMQAVIVTLLTTLYGMQAVIVTYCCKLPFCFGRQPPTFSRPLAKGCSAVCGVYDVDGAYGVYGASKTNGIMGIIFVRGGQYSTGIRRKKTNPIKQ